MHSVNRVYRSHDAWLMGDASPDSHVKNTRDLPNDSSFILIQQVHSIVAPVLFFNLTHYDTSVLLDCCRVAYTRTKVIIIRLLCTR